MQHLLSPNLADYLGVLLGGNPALAFACGATCTLCINGARFLVANWGWIGPLLWAGWEFLALLTLNCAFCAGCLYKLAIAVFNDCFE